MALSEKSKRALQTALKSKLLAGELITAMELAQTLSSLSTTELAYIDGVVAGTAAASKAVVLDSNGDVTLPAGADISTNTTTGTKIGTAVTQKVGFWNATPIVQPSGASQAAVTASTDFTGADTVDKATVLAAVQAVETLVNALRTALVNAGIIKGAA